MSTISLNSAVHFMQELRKIEAEFPAQIALAFLLIAKHPGINMKQLGTLTGCAKSSVSRTVQWLSDEYGRGLVTFTEAPRDRRVRELWLTQKGRIVLRSMLRGTGDHAA